MRENRLKRIWQEDKAAVSAWLSIPCSWTAELLAHMGFDALIVDMQHGLMDYQTALSMFQAISTTDAVTLTRVPWNEPGIIMRLLDAGAGGIICPMINNRSDAEAFVGACRYPPKGQRSYGPIRARLYGGDNYFGQSDKSTITLAMIETAEALENLDAILSVDELDGIYVGKLDLGISLGLANRGDPDRPSLRQAINKIVTAVLEHERIAGIHVEPSQSAARKMGFV